jgi:hypothetical protein
MWERESFSNFLDYGILFLQNTDMSMGNMDSLMSRRDNITTCQHMK